MKLFTLLTLTIFLSACNPSTSQISNVKKAMKEITKIPQLDGEMSFDYEDKEINQLPSGWSQSFTGGGKNTNWKIHDDNGNKILAQLSSAHPNYHFNVIVYDAVIAKNIELNVKMKGVTGEMDQGGGFVWRFIDKDNYYVVRANPLEDNVVLYKVEHGKRTDLPVLGEGRTYGVDVKPLGAGWNNLKLRVVDDLFTVFLNDEEIFKVKDETFMQAGKVGLWTKADAVSYFDDFYMSTK